jgi:CcmD family protein
MSSPVTAGWGYVAGGYGAIGALVAGYVVSVLRRRRSLGRRLRSGLVEPGRDEQAIAATTEEVQ